MRFTTAEDETLVSKVSEFPPLFNKDHKLNKNVVLKNNLWADVSKHVGRDVNECKKRWRDIKDNYFKIVRHLNRAPEGARKPLRWHLFDRLSFLKKPPGELETEIDYNGSMLSGDEHFGEDGLLLEGATLPCDVQLKSESSQIYDMDDSGGDGSSMHSNATHRDGGGVTGGDKRRFSSLSERDQEAAPIMSSSGGGGVKRAKFSYVEPGPGAGVNARSRSAEENDDVDYFMKSIALSVKKLPDFMIARAKEKILKIVHDLQFPANNA